MKWSTAHVQNILHLHFTFYLDIDNNHTHDSSPMYESIFRRWFQNQYSWCILENSLCKDFQSLELGLVPCTRLHHFASPLNIVLPNYFKIIISLALFILNFFTFYGACSNVKNDHITNWLHNFLNICLMRYQF